MVAEKETPYKGSTTSYKPVVKDRTSRDVKIVRIIGAKRSTFWYAKKIGSHFAVCNRLCKGDYIVDGCNNELRFISQEDCVIVDENP